MGNCLASGEDVPSSRSRGPGGAANNGSAPRKNQPLKNENPVWRSDSPLSVEQLRRKREEFWETAPAFEGRKEIWDALKAASLAMENADHGLAQAIVDGAGITLPTGTLGECYDELGNCYQLPTYVLSAPTNLAAPSGGAGLPAAPVSTADGAAASAVAQTLKDDTVLKLRLSTGKDIKLLVNAADTIAAAKVVLLRATGVEVERQRWFFGGRSLEDKMCIRDVKIPHGYVVQVLVV